MGDPSREALVALVACKDYKDTGLGMSLADYRRRKPLAWEAARAALSATDPGRDALAGLFGLVQLILGRDDLTDELRDVLWTSHRVLEAQRVLGVSLATGEPITTTTGQTIDPAKPWPFPTGART